MVNDHMIHGRHPMHYLLVGGLALSAAGLPLLVQPATTSIGSVAICTDQFSISKSATHSDNTIPINNLDPVCFDHGQRRCCIGSPGGPLRSLL